MKRPLIIGIGGATRQNSSSELALRASLRHAAAAGAETLIITGPDLNLPMYGADDDSRSDGVLRYIAALRRCDGVILASPGYHGSISGLLKNALDYIEDMRADDAPYLDGRAVACIVSAYGPQAMGTTLSAMRSIIHALRGWPTPMAAAFSAVTPMFDSEGACTDPAVDNQFRIIGQQVVEFAQMRASHRAGATGPTHVPTSPLPELRVARG